MRIGTLPALVCGVVIVLGGVAGAEKVKSNQSSEVYSRPGEASRILLRIREGQAMTLVSREGRWLKVRVKGRTGYVPRSVIDEDRDDRIGRNTRRRPFVDGRSTERGWAGGAPDDRVGADAVDVDRGDDDADDDDRDDRDDRGRGRDDDDDDDDRGKGRDDDDDDDRGKGRDDDDDDDRGRDRDDDDDDDDRGRKDEEEERPTVKVTAKRVTLYDRPSKSSEELGTARKGDTFYFMREDGKWVLLENDEGDAVWVKKSLVSRGGGGAGDRSRGTGRIMIGSGGAGVKLIGQKLKTPGGLPTSPPDNYNLGTSAATIAVGFELFYPYGTQYLVGGTVDYAGSKAVPGVAYNGASTGLTIHDFDVRASGGYDLKNGKGMVAYARLGYHYENMSISNVSDFTKNMAMIPSEIFRGPVVGAALDITRLTDTLALRLMLDTMVIGGKRSQTKNLEDGSNPKVKGAWLSGCLAYKWKPKMTINGTYELTYMSTDFGAQAVNSMRHPTATGNTTRRDLNHAVTVMVGYTF